jgi:hypothetical protein
MYLDVSDMYLKCILDSELLEAVEDTAKELCMPMRAKMSSMTMSIRRKRLDMSDNALPKVMTTMYRPFHTCA